MEHGWHSRLVRGLGAEGPEIDPRTSHPCFDFFPFSCDPRSYERKLCNCVCRSLKNSRLQRGLNP